MSCGTIRVFEPKPPSTPQPPSTKKLKKSASRVAPSSSSTSAQNSPRPGTPVASPSPSTSIVYSQPALGSPISLQASTRAQAHTSSPAALDLAPTGRAPSPARSPSQDASTPATPLAGLLEIAENITPERAARWVEYITAQVYKCKKGTKMLIVAVGDSDREVTEEVCRTQGHQDFVKEAIIGEFLAIVYLHVGNKDVRSDFGSDSGGEGVSRQAFFEGFIQMQVQDDWRDFWAHFKPDDQIAWKVEGRDFKNFCRPQTPHVIKERNSTVHDITLRNIHDVLVSMKQAGEYHSAHMLEQLCCAVTDTPYSDSWFRDDRKVKQLAELVRNRFPLLKPVATVDETDQKSRNLNTAIKIHEAAKKFEEKRKDDARAAWKKGVEAKGFCEISGADLIRDDIRQLKLLGAGLAAVVACLAYSRWAAK